MLTIIVMESLYFFIYFFHLFIYLFIYLFSFIYFHLIFSFDFFDFSFSSHFQAEPWYHGLSVPTYHDLNLAVGYRNPLYSNPAWLCDNFGMQILMSESSQDQSPRFHPEVMFTDRLVGQHFCPIDPPLLCQPSVMNYGSASIGDDIGQYERVHFGDDVNWVVCLGISG